MEADWGKHLDVQLIIETLKKHPQAKLCAIVMAETSTGVLQPLKELGEYIKSTPTLFLVDAVTALGGVNLEVDAWGVDICYSGTQKCLSVPPGLAPITFSPKAMECHKPPQKQGAELVSGHHHAAEVLGRGAGVSPHRAHKHDITGCMRALELSWKRGSKARFARHQDTADKLYEGLSPIGVQVLGG